MLTMATTQHLPIISTEPTSDSWLSRFLNEQMNPNTRRAYHGDLMDLLRATGGILNDTTLASYRALQHQASPRTGARRLSTANRFLQFLLLNRVIDRNPYALIGKLAPKVDKHDSPTVALTSAEVRRMMDWPDRATFLGASQRFAMVLGFHLGLRVSEMVGVRYRDVQDGKLHVLGKGKKKRVIPLTDLVREELASYFDACVLEYGEAPLENDYLLMGRVCHNPAYGRLADPVSSQTVWLWYAKVAHAVGIKKHVTPHTGRATVITLALDNGAGIRDVQVFAGHSSVETTSIYDKKRGEAAAKTVALIRY